MSDGSRFRRLLRELAPRPLRERYHRYAIARDFGIDRAKGARRYSPLREDLLEGLNLVGYFRSPSGVGQSVRSLVRAAQAAGISVERIEASEAEKRRGGPAPYDVTLYHANADAAAAVVEELGPALHRGRVNLGYWYWEAEEFPSRWRDRFDYFDEIWVASEFCARAIAAASPVPVVVMPPAVLLPEPPADVRRRAGVHASRFHFFTLFDALSVPERKNPVGTVRAFARAFPTPAPVSLLVRMTNAGRVPGLDAALREAAEGADVTLEEGELEREDLAALFAACDAYVSLHRAEGFGFPIAEAMSLGKPVVATDWSGSADFLDETTGFPVRWRPFELAERVRDYERGTRWAEPEEEHAVETLRRVVQNPEEASRRGEAGRQRIAERYSAGAAGQRLRKALEEARERARSRA